MAKIIAEKKPLVLKLDIKLSTNKTIKTVITNDINPRVKKFMGNVKMRKIVPMVAFAKAIRTPAIRALQKLATSTPGKRYAAIATAAPINKISIISLIINIGLIGYKFA